MPGYFQFAIDVGDGEVAALSWELSASSGFPPQQSPPVRLAVRVNEPIGVSVINGAIVADAVLDVTADNTTQAVVLTESCLPAGGGTVYLMFVNDNETDSAIGSIGLERTDPGDVEVATCN
jgi:hypothetical protein